MGKQVEVLNSTGQSQGSVELPDGLFEVEVSEVRDATSEELEHGHVHGPGGHHHH